MADQISTLDMIQNSSRQNIWLNFLFIVYTMAYDSAIRNMKKTKNTMTPEGNLSDRIKAKNFAIHCALKFGFRMISNSRYTTTHTQNQ